MVVLVLWSQRQPFHPPLDQARNSAFTSAEPPSVRSVWTTAFTMRSSSIGLTVTPVTDICKRMKGISPTSRRATSAESADVACPVVLETPWRSSLGHKSIQHSRIRPIEIRNRRFPSPEAKKSSDTQEDETISCIEIVFYSSI